MQKFKHEPVFFVFLIIAVFFRFSYLGFKYTPYLDDYIQYYYYPSFSAPWDNIFLNGAKAIFSRPLAVLFDFYVWSSLKNHIGVAVAILSITYGVSGILFFKAFRQINIDLGVIFFVVFLFLPINIEGTYWLSASTRIVFSFFLISLSLYLFVKNKVFFYAILNLMSLWFYEQTAILSLVLSVIFCFELKKHRCLLIPFFNFALLVMFYVFLGKNGDNASRMQIISPTVFVPHSLAVLREFVYLLGPFSARLTATAFVRSVHIFLRDNTLFWFAVSGLLSVFVVILSDFSAILFNKNKLIYGLMLALCPLLPFIVTQSNALNLRNIAPSLLGLALIVDGLLPVVFKNTTPIVASICLIIFSAAAVSEVCDYQKTAQHDYELAQSIANDALVKGNNITIRISSPIYLPQNAVYHDHIKSMVGSDWGVTGIVRTISGNRNLKITIKRGL